MYLHVNLPPAGLTLELGQDSLFKRLRSPSSKFRVDYSIVTWARKWATALTPRRRRVSHRTRHALTTFSHTYPLIIYPYAQYVSIPNLHVTFNPFSDPLALTDNPFVGLISTPGNLQYPTSNARNKKDARQKRAALWDPLFCNRRNMPLGRWSLQ